MRGYSWGCRMRRALVVDDMLAGRELLAEELREAGFAVTLASSGFQALEKLAERQFDLVVTDFQMPGIDGLELLRRVRESSNTPVIVITAYGTVPICERAMRDGAQRFLQFQRDVDTLGRAAVELVTDCDQEPPQSSLSLADARNRHAEDLRGELVRLVAECGGNIAEIGRRLGRDRSTVRYHLMKFGLLRSPSGSKVSK